MSTARERFERWYSDEGRSPRAVERDGKGDYVYIGAHTAWQTWQAALAQPGEGALTGWQPIETAPEDGEFLAFKPSLKAFTAVILNSDDIDCEYDGGVHCSWDHSYVEGATHWMPLPPPPGITSTPTGDSNAK